MKFQKDEWYRIEGKDYQFVEKLEGKSSYWEANWLFFNKSTGSVNLIAELKGNYYDLSHKKIEVKPVKKINQIELTDEEKFVTEMALRIVLCELLEKEKLMIDTVTATAHNLSIGSFGEKAFKPLDPNDWVQYLQPMRDLLDKLDPEYRKSADALGSFHYTLSEEEQ